MFFCICCQNAINSQEAWDGTSQNPSEPFPNLNELWVKAYKNKKDRIYGVGDEAVNIKDSFHFSPTKRNDTVLILKFH